MCVLASWGGARTWLPQTQRTIASAALHCSRTASCRLARRTLLTSPPHSSHASKQVIKVFPSSALQFATYDACKDVMLAARCVRLLVALTERAAWQRACGGHQRLVSAAKSPAACTRTYPGPALTSPLHPAAAQGPATWAMARRWRQAWWQARFQPPPPTRWSSCGAGAAAGVLACSAANSAQPLRWQGSAAATLGCKRWGKASTRHQAAAACAVLCAGRKCRWHRAVGAAPRPTWRLRGAWWQVGGGLVPATSRLSPAPHALCTGRHAQPPSRSRRTACLPGVPCAAERGLRGLFQGFPAGLANNSVSLALGFASYEVQALHAAGLLCAALARWHLQVCSLNCRPAPLFTPPPPPPPPLAGALRRLPAPDGRAAGAGGQGRHWRVLCADRHGRHHAL